MIGVAGVSTVTGTTIITIVIARRILLYRIQV